MYPLPTCPWLCFPQAPALAHPCRHDAGRPARARSAAFTITEVAIALGLISFALMTLLALLPMGINSNANSAEETRAVCLLSAIRADLSNTHPQAAAGRSKLFAFQLPYATDAEGRHIFNPDLTGPTAALGNGTTTGLDEAGRIMPLSANPRYQASVVYTAVPPPGTPGDIQARLIVNWPSLNTSTVTDLTEPKKTRGFVEALISFPAP